MAGIALTQARRSELVKQLLAQQGDRPQIRSGGELAARLAAQVLRQKKLENLRQQDADSQQELIEALQAGQPTSGQAVTLENFEGGSGRQQVAIPGRRADPGASRDAISRLPAAQQLQAAQIQGARRQIAEPTQSQAATTAFERQRDLQSQSESATKERQLIGIDADTQSQARTFEARDADLTKTLNAQDLRLTRQLQADWALQERRIEAKQQELAAGGDFNSSQWIAAGYAVRTEDAGQVLDDIGEQFSGFLAVGGLSPSSFKSADRQRFEQARRNFLNAQLRRESGAVISPSEFEEGNLQYFPQRNDTKEVLDQKAQNRTVVIEALKGEGSGAYTQLRDAVPPQQTGGDDERLKNLGL